LLPSGPTLGGAPFNFACRVGSLGDRALIASRLGCDELGQRARERLQALGLDARLVQRDELHPTGTVRITLDARGNPDFDIVPDAAYDYIEATPALLEAAAAADCICFGTLVQRSAAARAVLERVLAAAPNVEKFLDLNLRRDCYSPETIVASLDRADLLKMNQAEAEHLAEHFGFRHRSLPAIGAAALDRWKLTRVLITLGERGGYAAGRNGEQVYAPGYAVPVVDTCGSGDAFSAGFIHAHLRGQSLAECCELGNALGALVATQKGATAPIPAAALEAFRRAKHQRIGDPEFERFAVA
ncbi:MAG: hypothetical protein KGS61_01965, partial [Verrucomicrobia bacterium]|nr:hypothetical protein [Verrucomicrobiota bacterium]